MTMTRREIVSLLAKSAALAALPVSLLPRSAFADACEVQHPLMPPRADLPGQCVNCGMVRPMWARTWKRFSHPDGFSEACSFHCLAEIALKSGVEPQEVQTALYMTPERFLGASAAVFLVGSRAPGTMSPVSKLAFLDRGEAEKLRAECGGEILRYAEVLAQAKEGVVQENAMIDKNRLAKGKIKEPVAGETKCAVCGMLVADYPRNRCQVQGKDGATAHFCSTQCLTAWQAMPEQYQPRVEAFLAWVTDSVSGRFIGARSAYYVVGSKAMGPMGPEGFAFDKADEARAFAAKEGGRVVIWQGLTPAAVSGK